MAVPRLGDLSSSKIKFKAGDRVIARVNQPLRFDQINKILSSIDKYAGVALNSILVDCSSTEIIRERGSEKICLAGRHHYSIKENDDTFKFGCSVVEIKEKDIFLISIKTQTSQIRTRIYERFKKWVGDCEIILLPWNLS